MGPYGEGGSCVTVQVGSLVESESLNNYLIDLTQHTCLYSSLAGRLQMLHREPNVQTTKSSDWLDFMFWSTFI